MGFYLFKFFCTYAILPPLSDFFFWIFKIFKFFLFSIFFSKQNAQKHAKSILQKIKKHESKQKDQRTPSQTEKKGPAHVLKQKIGPTPVLKKQSSLTEKTVPHPTSCRPSTGDSGAVQPHERRTAGILPSPHRG